LKLSRLAYEPCASTIAVRGFDGFESRLAAFLLVSAINIELHLFLTKRLGVLAADPHGVLLVDAGRAGQGALGQRADGDQAAHDGQGLLALADALAERLVAVGLRLNRVVPVLGEHTTLEATDNLGALACRTDILGGNGRHAAHARLADVGVGRAILARNADNLASDATDVAGTQC